MIAIFLAACKDDPEETTDTADTTPSADPLPIDEALAGRCKDPTPPRVFPTGTWMHKATLEGATATCNDGSPPVLYARTNSDAAHANDWVVQLLGDGACVDYETCASRWCGEGATDAGDMSTDWAPIAAGQAGIFLPDATTNEFAGWNVVQVYYCSSDNWVGTKSTVLASEVTGEAPMEVPFQGKDILDAALDALDAGVVSDDALILLPSLLNAETIVFAGSEAGGYGVVANIGRVSARYPSARVIGAVEAVFSPSPDAIDGNQANYLSAVILQRYDETFAPVWGAYVDEGCVASGENAAECSDVGVMLREHVTNEMIIRHDLLDAASNELAFLAQVRGEDYPLAGEATLRGYQQQGFSVLGPACGSHEVMDGGPFFAISVADSVAGPPALTFEQALAALVAGEPRSAVDTPDALGSVCQ